MRMTQLEINRNLLNDLDKLNKNFVDVNRQLTSTKKLNSLSDSPLGSAYLVDITQQALRLDAYSFNVTSSAYQLKSAESALNAVNNVFVSIHTLGMRAANETSDPAGRLAILNEIENLREELIARGNTQVDGRYIFAGTKIDAKPFDDTQLGKLAYRGNDVVNLVPIGDDVKVKAGVTGEALAEVLEAVDGLIESIRASIPPPGGTGTGTVEDIGKYLEGTGARGPFAEALTELGQARGQLGVSLSVVDRMSEMIGARNNVLREQRSNIEDANVLEVVVRISELQTAINAAMSGGSVILGQRNLFDVVG